MKKLGVLTALVWLIAGSAMAQQDRSLQDMVLARRFDLVDQWLAAHPQATAMQASWAAQALWAQGRYEQADQLLAVAQDAMPSTVRPFSDLLRCLAAERGGRQQQAQEMAQKLEKSGSQLAGYFAALALSRLDPLHRVEHLESALGKTQSPQRRLTALRSLAQEGALSVQQAAELLTLDPQNELAQQIGLQHFRAGATNSQLIYALGQFFYRQKEDQQALELFEQVQKDSPFYLDSLYYVGVVLGRMKQFTQACDFYAKLLSIDQTRYVNGPVNRLVAIATNSVPESATKAKEILRNAEQKGNEKIRLAALSGLARAGDQDATQRLLTNFPQSNQAAELLWQQGFALWNRQAYQEAERCWAEAQTDDLENAARLLYWRAQAFLKLHNEPKAKELQQQAVRLYPLTYYGLLCGGWEQVKTRSKQTQPQIASVTELEQWGFLTHAKLVLEDEDDLPSKVRAAQLSLQLGLEADAFTLLRPFYRSLTTDQAHQAYIPLLWPRPYREMVVEQGQRFAVEPSLIWAVMRQESGFNPQATSWTGAGGLMQLMPGTAKDEEKRIGDGPLQRYDPRDNIKLGASHLSWLSKTFSQLREIIAAYNGGSGNVRKWNARFEGSEPDVWIEQIPFDETRDYVKKVLENLMIYRSLERDEHEL